MDNNNMTPQLRFPEFEGNLLNQDEFNSFCEINPNKGELPDRFIYIDLESVNKGRLEKENRISKDGAPSRAQRVLQKGDILYQTVRPYQKNNYFFDKDGDYVASTGYAQIRTGQNEKYFFQYFHTTQFVNNVLKRCTGTSYPAIGTTDLAKVPITIPTLPEQTKIATFLTAVDKRIKLLQKKKAELEQYKKSVMQKLFSQEIRFKQDDGSDFPDWEEKKLGDIGTFTSGTGFSNSEQGGIKGIPFLKVSDMNLDGNEKEITIANNYVTIEQVKRLKYKPITKSSIIFAKVGAAIFLERKRIASNFLIDNNMMSFTPRGDIIFFKYLFDTLRLSKFAQVGALPSYNASDLKTIKIQLPYKKEQQKIANFLSSIDKSIEKLGNQIDESQQWKKGLLQKMFV